MTHTRTRRGSRLAAAAAAVLMLAAVVVLGGRSALPGPFGAGTVDVRPAAPLAKSSPVSLDIPRLGVHTSVVRLGLDGRGEVEVPPFRTDSPAGWYRHSPTPGQLGPAVILGHSTVRDGASVFARVHELERGDRIDVRRKDGSVAHFTVERVETHPKSAFPTQQVYGDLDYPGLRLVTCGGERAAGSHEYPDNVIADAALTGSS
jgi:Sortase domain